MNAALDQLPALSLTLSSLETASQAAVQSASSAETALELSVTLAARRMQRSESLLKQLRSFKAELEAGLSALQTALVDITSAKARRAGAWDRLPDAWWIERSSGVSRRIEEVAERVRELDHSLEVAGSGEYLERVKALHSGVERVADSWQKALGFVAEWEDVARAVSEGLGEEGSLINC